MSYKPFEAILQAISDNTIQEVSLSHRGLDDAQCGLLSEAVTKTTSVVVLDLQGNVITNAGVQLLCDALAKNTSVQELGLAANNIDEEGAKRLLSLLDVNTTIRSIHLANNAGVSQELIKSIDFRASVNMQPQKFKVIVPQLLAGEEVSEVDVSDTKGTLSIPLLVNVLKQNPSVRTLRLNGAGLGDMGVDIIGAMLKENKTLEHLDLAENGISIHGVRNLCQSGLKVNTGVKRLSLRNNKIGDDAARILITLLRENDHLIELDIAENAVTQGVAEILAYSLELNKQPLPLKRARQAVEANSPDCTEIRFPWEPGMELAAYFLAPVLRQSQFVQHLNLSNARMGDDGAQHIAHVLKTNKSLRCVELANNNISSVGAIALADALGFNTTLTELNLANNLITNEGVSAFAVALQSNDTLATMNIELNQCSDDLFDEVEGLLLVNTQPIALKRLLPRLEANDPEVTSVDFSQYDGVRYLNDNSALILSRSLAKNHIVKEVDLSGNSITDAGAVHFAAVLGPHPSIVSLTLDNNAIGDRGGQALAESLHSNTVLRALSLRGNTCGESTAEAVLAMLQANNFVNDVNLEATRVSKATLNEIKIAGTMNLQPQSLKRLLPHLRSRDPELKDLNLSGPAENAQERLYDDTAVTILCHEMGGNENILTLDLSDNYVSPVGCKALAGWILEPATRLEELRLFGNSIGNEGVANLLEALKKSPTLRLVDLRSANVTDEGAALLLQALHENYGLKTVMVSKEQLSAPFAAALTREITINSQPKAIKDVLPAILSNDPSLAAVELTGNDDPAQSLDDVSCQLLAHALTKNSNVKVLHLARNQITSAGVEYLADMLEDNASIVAINLQQNQIDDAGAKMLINVLTKNYTLRELDLQGNPVSQECNGDVEYLLRVNNAPYGLKAAMVELASNAPELTMLPFDGDSQNMKFDDGAVRILCSLLVKNTYVTHISLANNHITDVGASYIADLLRINSIITHIDLFGNEISEEGALYLWSALKTNHTCVSLGLGKNPIPPKAEVFENLQGAINVNSTPLVFPAKKRGEFKKRVPISNLNNQIMFKDSEYMHDVEDQVWTDGMVHCPKQFTPNTGVKAIEA